MTLILKGTDNSVSSPAVQGGTAGTTTGEYFPTTNQWAVATNGTQAMLVNASQRVGINNATPQGVLDVGGLNGGSAGDLLVDSTSTAAVVTVGRISGVGNDNTNFRVRNRIDQQAFLVNSGNRTAQVATTFGVGDTTPATSGAGITFPATQSASSDANTLDDYEEGSWTPTFSVGGSTFTGRGWYVKVGVICHIGANNLEGVSAISDGATAIITGLPFNIKQDSGTNNYKYGSGVAILFSDQSDGYNNKPLSGRINPATPVAGSASAAKIDFRNISGVATTTSDPITFGGSYITE